jgi:hypothetical protein
MAAMLEEVDRDLAYARAWERSAQEHAERAERALVARARELAASSS